MSNLWVAVVFGIGVGGWAYSQLAKRNGNASPGSNATAAGAAGLIAAIVLFTLFKFVFNF